MSVDYARPERPRAHAWERLWRPYWALPAIVAVGSAGLGLTLPRADERLAGWVPYVFESGPDGARQLLGTIASAMISVTGLVFSLTMVVLQLASSQFTPRLLGQFLQSRVVQLTLGVFVGSFLYALTVLRLIRGGDGTDFVPQVSVTLAFGYVLAAVAFFIAFIHHITQSIRLSHVLIDIGARTTASARRLYAGQRPSATWSPAPQTPRQVLEFPAGPGVITALDSTGLVRWAAQRDCVVVLEFGLGDFRVEGDRMAVLWGLDDLRASSPSDLAGELAELVGRSGEPDLATDFSYGIRQLTDIAERALSPGVNDPTTAIQVINQLYAVLTPLACRPDLSPYLTDDEGVVRAMYRAPSFAGLICGSLQDIAHYAAESPRVCSRLREVAELLSERAIETHRPSLRRVLASLPPELPSESAPED